MGKLEFSLSVLMCEFLAPVRALSSPFIGWLVARMAAHSWNRRLSSGPFAMIESLQHCEPLIHLQAWTINSSSVSQGFSQFRYSFPLLNSSLTVRAPGLCYLMVFEEIHVRTCSSALVPDPSRSPGKLLTSRPSFS